ncbi:MAG: HEAT repeat domain-containing protein [Chloracidobacterium sp.]|nr:HEAT repeat domain-containing protein [Chloracidobacterium sp.]
MKRKEYNPAMTANLQRTLRAASLCVGLLVAGYFFLFYSSAGSGSTAAKDDPIELLLRLPAPAPPNPLVPQTSLYNRDEKFYSKSNVPKDNAPIDELLDYWLRQNNSAQDLRYMPEISDQARSRIMKEISKKPALLTSYLNVLKGDAKAADFVKEIYDREGNGGAINKEERRMVKEWLMYNSPYFSTDLARKASSVNDSGEYVTGQQELLSLARVDFDRAKPIIDRLLGDSSLKTSKVLATWAQYRHALDTNSTGDIETYRDALKAFVEDKNAMPGMRDLAMDALFSEKEWSGRDEWYFSLLGDETLAKLVVNGQTNTGLTTLILNSPEDKYVEKMIELVGSNNPTVRSNAVRNLIAQLNIGNAAVVKALLPWLEDQKWAIDVDDSRGALVRKLSEIEVPESVPGLIKILDEKHIQSVPVANTAFNAANAAANAANTAANRASISANRPASNVTDPSNTSQVIAFPFRSSAVAALAKQKDGRAVPALRRVLPEMSQSYERDIVVSAIWECNGFSLAEQLDALETAAKGVRTEMDNEANLAANANAVASNYATTYENEGKRAPTPAEIRASLGRTLLQAPAIPDVLARGVVDRIAVLDTKDKPLALAYRRMILRWQNAAINILLLRDLKRGVADLDTIIRLLGQRKELRVKQSTDIFDIRTGTPTAFGISACLLEDSADYDSILDNGNIESKTALFACARLLRLPLQVPKVAENLKSPNPLLQTAAERYLESEDSLEARAIVLARHPNEAKILGARSAFMVDGVAETYNEYLYAVYQSLGDSSLYNGWSGAGNDDQIIATEKELQAEVKKSDDLVGIYSYDDNYIRIYKDRVMFSWDEDDSRYRERPLSGEEFDAIKGYLAHNKVDELPPFISCGGAYCEAKELIMLSRVGGRRVYMTGTDGEYGGGGEFEFFVGLDKYFAGLKQAPAKLKYRLSREIPGLEIVLAADDLNAVAVWKDGSDFRVAASEKAVRDKIKKEIDGDPDDENAPVEDYSEEIEGKKAELRAKRRYEGYAWYKIEGSEVAGITSQPAGVEFLPMRDGLGVPAGEEQWKARLADLEIRASEDGLFKVVRGRLTKVRDGNYRNPVITPNGRWVLVGKQDDQSGQAIFRVDLTTNKEYQVELEGYGESYPLAFIPSINKILVIRNDYRYYRSDDEDTALADSEPGNLLLVDPATGVANPAPGEFRPVAQQTYRALQKTAKPNEYWAAMIDEEKGLTEIGIYETKTFGFKPIMKVPKIRFNSMNMWVDEPGKKVYFVYRGHLLSLPLP